MTQRLGACYVIVNDRIDFRIKIYKFVKAGKRKKEGSCKEKEALGSTGRAGNFAEREGELRSSFKDF